MAAYAKWRQRSDLFLLLGPDPDELPPSVEFISATYVNIVKTAYSPPSCSSAHEAGCAIDIDAFDTVVAHRRVRQILNDHGWTHIVEPLTGPECWYHELREEA